MNPRSYELRSDNLKQVPSSLRRQREAIYCLLLELQDLKRIRSAEFEDTFAAHRYRRVMRHLAKSFDVSQDLTNLYQIAMDETLLAVITTRVGALGPSVLRHLGVASERVREICQSALHEHRDAWPNGITAESLEGIVKDLDSPVDAMDNENLETLINRLCAEPRAGATAAGKSRVLVVPQESQAEHCYLTAVTAVVLAEHFEADPGEAFTVALLHHLHNAFMPDAGFAGETLLGSSLDFVVDAARRHAFELLPATLRGLAAEAVHTMTHLETPVARVVNAADAIDRVLQTRFHEQMATFDAERVQRDLDLVHEGPLQIFQNEVLRVLGVTC